MESVDFNEPISPSLERRVLVALSDVCEGYLAAYPTNVAQDEALMRDRGMFAALSRQNRMAIKLRASEKKILLRTIEAVKDELLKLPSIVTGETGAGEKILAAGRSFDTYKDRPTVASAKAMTDWVEVKGQPASKPAAGESEDGGAASVAERRRRRRLGNK